MNSKFRKVVITVLVVIFSCSFVFARGSRENQNVENATRIFVDDLGRSVELKSHLTKIAPSGNMATVILLTFDPSMMTGLSRRVDNSYFKEDLSKKPLFGAMYSYKDANFNKEEVISSGAEVIIDIGEIKGDVESMSKSFDELSEVLGIPVVFIKSNFDDIDHTYVTLGSLLDRKERGEELAKYAKEAIRFAQDIKNENKNSTKTFYYSTANDGLQSFSSTNLHTELFNKIGAKNIMEGASGSGVINVSLEEIISKNPDIILFESKEAYDIVNAKNSRWKNIKAVKNGDVYLVPKNIYSWIDSPPSINRLLGVYYLADVFYPNTNIDVKKEAKKYFKLFYDYDLKDSEINL